MAPMKKRSEKKGGKKEIIRWKLRMDLHCEQQQQEVMEVSFEEKEKKTRHPSLQIRLGRRQKQVSLDSRLAK
jgi:phosphate-selective porin